jgi:MFS superfamily sulfate permease-like transporter
VAVIHFHKNFTTFGTPLLIKLCDQETFKDVKNRIQKKLNISQYEWEKYKLAIVQNKTINPVDDNEKVALDKFQSTEEDQRCILGLHHTSNNEDTTNDDEEEIIELMVPGLIKIAVEQNYKIYRGRDLFSEIELESFHT